VVYNKGVIGTRYNGFVYNEKTYVIDEISPTCIAHVLLGTHWYFIK